MNEELLKKRLQRAEAKVAALEDMIEEKTRDLFLSNEELRGANEYLTRLYDVMPGALFVVQSDGRVRNVNDRALELLGATRESVEGTSVDRFSPSLSGLSTTGADERFEDTWTADGGVEVPVLVSWSPISMGDQPGTVVVGVDMRERRALELELRHAQKLESVGQLAAGVAHEINTPMQFIGDNVHFLREAFEDLTHVHHLLARVLQAAQQGTNDATLLSEATEAIEDADVEFLVERAPKAFDRTLEGVERVSSIVAAMKAFSHPQGEKSLADLNELVNTTLTVARNEYKYVADLDLDLGTLPMVSCHAGDLQQVILNVIVNAAHAITDTLDEVRTRGRISVRSYCEAGSAVISVSDDGPGIPVDVQPRVFEPFYTTKEVGQGTGQGLAISYSLITDKHGGSLTFDTEQGKGTTFLIRIPLATETQPMAAPPAVPQPAGVS